MYADNPNFPYMDNFVVYEPLKEKPQYEKTVEYTREGSISETNKNHNIHNISGIYRGFYGYEGNINQIPYRFW